MISSNIVNCTFTDSTYAIILWNSTASFTNCVMTGCGNAIELVANAVVTLNTTIITYGSTTDQAVVYDKKINFTCISTKSLLSVSIQSYYDTVV